MSGARLGRALRDGGLAGGAGGGVADDARQGIGRALRDGVLAGGVGGAAMSVSTNVEMRLRGRPPSVVPVQTVERLLGLDLERSTEERLVTVGHVVSSALLGSVRGLLSLLALPEAARDVAFAASAFLPDFGLIPATGSVPPPWRWSASDVLVAAWHHAVYAAGTIAAYRRLTAGRD
jgi:hypothetical protein